MSDNQSELREILIALYRSPLPADFSIIPFDDVSTAKRIMALIEAREKQLLESLTQEYASDMGNKIPEWFDKNGIYKLADFAELEDIVHKTLRSTVEQLTHPSSKEEVTND